MEASNEDLTLVELEMAVDWGKASEDILPASDLVRESVEVLFTPLAPSSLDILVLSRYQGEPEVGLQDLCLERSAQEAGESVSYTVEVDKYTLTPVSEVEKLYEKDLATAVGTLSQIDKVILAPWTADSQIVNAITKYQDEFCGSVHTVLDKTTGYESYDSLAKQLTFTTTDIVKTPDWFGNASIGASIINDDQSRIIAKAVTIVGEQAANVLGAAHLDIGVPTEFSQLGAGLYSGTALETATATIATMKDTIIEGNFILGAARNDPLPASMYDPGLFITPYKGLVHDPVREPDPPPDWGKCFYEIRVTGGQIHQVDNLLTKYFSMQSSQSDYFLLSDENDNYWYVYERGQIGTDSPRKALLHSSPIGYICADDLPIIPVEFFAENDENGIILGLFVETIVAKMEEFGFTVEYSKVAVGGEIRKPTKSKRGPRNFSKQEKIEALHAWDALDRDVNPIKLEDWLEQRFGATPGGTLMVAVSTFYSWRKLVKTS